MFNARMHFSNKIFLVQALCFGILGSMFKLNDLMGPKTGFLSFLNTQLWVLNLITQYPFI